jgi:hypothetical protein
MKDENGNEIQEPTQLSTEELIAKTVSGVLEAQKNEKDPDQNINEPEIDPFDFSDINNGVNDNQPNPNDNLNTNDQYNQFDPNNANNINNQNNPPANIVPQQLYDPRVDDMIANNAENTRTTKMTSFMMELNNSLAGLPEQFGLYKNTAIEEAKKSINSGQYIPANDMLSYLHGKDAMAKAKNIEPNPNPSIGGSTDINPNGDEKPFDPFDPNVSAEDLKEKFGNIQF